MGTREPGSSIFREAPASDGQTQATRASLEVTSLPPQLLPFRIMIHQPRGREENKHFCLHGAPMPERRWAGNTPAVLGRHGVSPRKNKTGTDMGRTEGSGDRVKS